MVEDSLIYVRRREEQKNTSVSNFFQTVLVNIYAIGVHTTLSDDTCALVDKLLDVAFFTTQKESTQGSTPTSSNRGNTFRTRNAVYELFR